MAQLQEGTEDVLREALARHFGIDANSGLAHQLCRAVDEIGMDLIDVIIKGFGHIKADIERGEVHLVDKSITRKVRIQRKEYPP